MAAEQVREELAVLSAVPPFREDPALDESRALESLRRADG